jgi:hypothetical protein
MAAACIFLAGKVGEQPKKLKPLITALHQHMPRQTAQIEALNEKTFNEMKIRMLGNERVLLQQLCFDLSVENTNTFLFKYARVITVNKGEKMPNVLVQKAHELIDDSYKTTLCVEYPPQIIAVALLHLASKFFKGVCTLDEAPDKPWYSKFIDAPIDGAITDICTRVLDVLAMLKQMDAKPAALKTPSNGASPASPALNPTGAGGGSGGGGGGGGGQHDHRNGMPGLSAVGGGGSQPRRAPSSDSRRAGQEKHQSARHHPY